MSHKDTPISAIPLAAFLFISPSFCLFLIYPSLPQTAHSLKQMVFNKWQRDEACQNIVCLLLRTSKFPRGQTHRSQREEWRDRAVPAGQTVHHSADSLHSWPWLLNRQRKVSEEVMWCLFCYVGVRLGQILNSSWCSGCVLVQRNVNQCKSCRWDTFLCHHQVWGWHKDSFFFILEK